MKEFLNAYEKRDGICVSFYPQPKGKVVQQELRGLMELDEPCSNDRPNGIYIHIPFCDEICAFCPFNKFKKDEETVIQYLKYLKKEIDLYSESEFGKTAVFDSVYLGGGTPTALSAEQLLTIFDWIKHKFKMTEDAVYFVEGNPLNYTLDKMSRLHAIGINRISMGVQTFDDDIARYIGLPQTPAESRKAILNAKKVGIENVGIDLMYPLPGMDYAIWAASIKTAINLEVDHVCIIPFCILPQTPVEKKIKTGEIPPILGQDEEVRMYVLAKEMLINAGYIQYSVLDFMLPDKADKAAANYFTKQGNTLALGTAGYGYINGYTYFNIGSINQYMKHLKDNQFPIITGAKADRKEEMRGMMAKGLRMLNVDRTAFMKLFGTDPLQEFDTEIQSLCKRGLLKYDNRRISLTEKGTVWGNDVCKEFFAKAETIGRVELAKGRIKGDQNEGFKGKKE